MYRLLVESVTDYGIVMLNREGRLEMWNAGAEDITGYGAEEIVGRHVSCLYSPDDVAKGKPEEELATAVRLGRCEDEGWWVRKDGTRFWADVITTALRDKTGVLRGYSRIIRDVSQRKSADEELRASEQRFRTMAEAIPAMVAIFVGTGHAYVNRAGETMLGYTRDELLKLSFLEYVHPDFRDLVRQRSLARQRGEDVPERYEIKLKHKSGRDLWIDFAASALRRSARASASKMWNADTSPTRTRGGKSHMAPLARLPSLSLRVRVFDMASTRFLRLDSRERLPGIA
jgi:PAS domain S-box-containing protein